MRTTFELPVVFFHRLLRLAVAGLVLSGLLWAPAVEAEDVPAEWRTVAERTDFRATGRYEDTLAFLERLADESPEIHLTTYGTSGQGRPLPLVIVSKERAFTPEAAAELADQRGKPVLLIQNGIHAGEIDGKDAGFLALRELLERQTAAEALDHVVLLFVPVFSVDGHERFGRWNRPNQRGPEAMGWRTTAQNLNLNRDYMKADTPETRAWLRLWNEWQPDLFIDCHVTDGADYRCNITYHHEHHAAVDDAVLEWERDVFG